MSRLGLAGLFLAADAASALRSGAPSARLQPAADQGAALELANYLDLQYYARLQVGTPPQNITAIIDTGSFELVIFSSTCRGCGTAGAFNGSSSSSHRLGRLVTELTYGSGDVEGDQAEDLVALGDSRAALQNFWEVHRASMPLLEHARFQSILGVGPPETPAADAWDFVSRAVHEVTSSLNDGNGRGPSGPLVKNVENSLISAMEISQTQTMLSNFGIRAFSICLGRKPLSSGHFIWNDTAASDRPLLFWHLPVVGKHSWTVRMTDARLQRRGPNDEGADAEPSLGCREGGCGAIIDSGTSLLVAPAGAISVLSDVLQTASPDCDSLQELPSLVLSFAGVELSLPPDAYVSRKRDHEPCKLELSLLESKSTSEAGPVWILGMPFLRQYYTTFDVGENFTTRALHVAPASSNCTPAGPELKLAADRAKPYLRSLDWESMYLPPLVRQVTSQAFLDL